MGAESMGTSELFLEMDDTIRAIAALDESLQVRSVAVQSMGPRLAAMGVRARPSCSTLGARLVGRGSVRLSRRIEAAAVDAARRIVPDSSPHNSILLGAVSEHFLVGAVPVLLWPARFEFLVDILLRRKLVMTFYNPAGLLGQLEQSGFKVTTRGRKVTLERGLEEGGILRSSSMSYYFAAVQDHFFPEDAVVKIFELLGGHAKLARETGADAVKISTSIHQHAMLWTAMASSGVKA
jgi:hypothetical protein